MIIESRKPNTPRKPPTLSVTKSQVLRKTTGSAVRTHSPLMSWFQSYCKSAGRAAAPGFSGTGGDAAAAASDSLSPTASAGCSVEVVVAGTTSVPATGLAGASFAISAGGGTAGTAALVLSL